MLFSSCSVTFAFQLLLLLLLLWSREAGSSGQGERGGQWPPHCRDGCFTYVLFFGVSPFAPRRRGAVGGLMKHASDYTFSQVPRAEIPRSVFNRSHQYKTTFDSGLLIPFLVDEALPGDTFKVNVSLLARLATPLVPLMDNIHLDVFFFAVPHRLVWSNWQRFCGEQPTPGASTDFLVPIITTISNQGSMFDYMGIPTTPANISFSALFPRAYNLIWNEWFRDQNLQVPVSVPLTDGPDSAALYVLKRRGKRHDYFTSALPWPQKGPGVTLPLGGFATVVESAPNSLVSWADSGGNARRPAQLAHVGGAPGTEQLVGRPDVTWGVSDLYWKNPIGLKADLTTATAVTINAMRESFQIQKLLERDARGGTRYTEIVKSHFGVTSPDARLQRPEYLGGGSAPVVINPVTQNVPTDGTSTPLGSLGAYGRAGSSGIGFTKSFVEHSIIIGLVMARADVTYQQGINRMMSRRTRYDYYWPALSHLGEQTVLNKEIWARGDANDALVFGYQERWAEYRYYPSMITGKMRSDVATPLDIWHLAQKFTTLPVLSTTFIEENPPIARVVAVPSEPQFIFDSYIQCQAARPMPVYSVPGLIDHF